MQDIKSVAMERAAFMTNSYSNVNPTGKVDKKSDFDSYLNFGSSNSTKQAEPAVKSADNSNMQQSSTPHKLESKKPDVDVKREVSVSDDASAADTVNDTTVKAVENEIADKVKETLDIDDEAFAEAMTALGMIPLDLLDVNNLQQLVLFVNGSSDLSDFITDEGMMFELNELTEVLSEIDWEDLTGMSKEDFAEALSKALEQQGDNAQSADSSIMTTDSNVQSDILTEQTADELTQQEYQTDTAKTDTVSKENMAAAAEEVSDDEQPQVIVKDYTAKGNITENVQSQQQSDSQQGQSSGQSSDSMISAQSDTHEVPHGEVVGGTAEFLQNLNQAVADAGKMQNVPQSNAQQMVDIVNQVVQQIRVTMGRETTTMQMQLQPQNLGKVLISVSSNNGVMTANFTVQSEEAKEALQSQIYQLRETLESRNLKVEAVEVEVSDFAFSKDTEAGEQDSKSFEKGDGKSRKFNFSLGGDDEAEDVESVNRTTERKPRLDAGSSIDFTA